MSGQQSGLRPGNELPVRGRRRRAAAAAGRAELRRVCPGEECAGRPEGEQRVDAEPGAAGDRKLHLSQTQVSLFGQRTRRDIGPTAGEMTSHFNY